MFVDSFGCDTIMPIVPKASKAAKRIDKAKVFGKTPMYLKKNKMKAKPTRWQRWRSEANEVARGAATQQDDDPLPPLKLTYTLRTVKKRPASAAFASASAAHTPTSASQETKETRVSILSAQQFAQYKRNGPIHPLVCLSFKTIAELTNIINIAIEKLLGKDADRYAVFPAEDWYDVNAQHGIKTEKRIHGAKV